MAYYFIYIVRVICWHKSSYVNISIFLIFFFCCHAPAGTSIWSVPNVLYFYGIVFIVTYRAQQTVQDSVSISYEHFTTYCYIKFNYANGFKIIVRESQQRVSYLSTEVSVKEFYKLLFFVSYASKTFLLQRDQKDS